VVALLKREKATLVVPRFEFCGAVRVHDVLPLLTAHQTDPAASLIVRLPNNFLSIFYR